MNIRLLRKRHEPPAHAVWRALRITAGVIVLLLGTVLLVPGIPGPGIAIILVGLWILSADIRLARRALMRLRIVMRRARRRYRKFRERREDERTDLPS